MASAPFLIQTYLSCEKRLRFKNNMRLENIYVRVIDLVSLDLAPPFSLTRFRGRRQLPQAG